MSSLFALVLSIASIGCICGQPLNTAELVSRIELTEKSSLQDVFAAAVALSSSDSAIPETICSRLRTETPSFIAFHIAAIARCDSKNFTPTGEPESIEDLYHLSLVNPEPHLFDSLVQKLKNANQLQKMMILDAGAFIIQKDASSVNATTAYETFMSTLRQVIIRVSSSDGLKFDRDASSPIELADHLGSACYALQSCGAFDVGSQFAQNLAYSVIKQQYATSPSDISSLLRLAKVLSKNMFRVPVVADVIEAKKGVLDFKLTNVIGEPISSISATVASCKDISGPQSLIDGEAKMKPMGGSRYHIKFETEKKTPGNYIPVIRVETESLGAILLPHISEMCISVFGSAEPAAIDIWTSSKEVDRVSAVTPRYPEKSKHMLLIDSSSTHLNARFKIKHNLDHLTYVGVALVNKNSSQSVILFPSRLANDTFSVRVKYTHSVFSNGVPGNGNYELSLIVSDPRLPKAIKWVLCESIVNLVHAPGALRLEQLYAHMEQPQIRHSFRSSESRCNPLLSLFFTAVIIGMTIFGLLPAWNAIGLNITTPTPMGILFYALLTSVFCVLCGYWVNMSLFDVLKYLFVLGPFVAFSGHRFLKAHMRKIKKKVE